jgi:DNA-binding GntR family transcriptional regulator
VLDYPRLSTMASDQRRWQSATVCHVGDDQDPRVYVRIAADLRRKIEAGELQPGQPAPSITTLTQQWGVARETAAHALTTLEAEGLVKRYPGRGYYVMARN